MSSEVKRREPGTRAFPPRECPKLVLVPPAQKPRCPDARTELSEEVKEMLREMNRRHRGMPDTEEDAPDAAGRKAESNEPR